MSQAAAIAARAMTLRMAVVYCKKARLDQNRIQ
jgi:hypothetical protein